MKCLVIHGSPRRGNTWDVLKIVKEEMNKEGRFQFEEVELSKEKLPTCIGCFNCILKGEDKCPHHTIIENIVEKMNSADVFIFTSPVYSMQVSGLLKNFIDHMSYNFHRPRFYNKKVLVITTTAGAGHKSVAKYIKSVMHYWGVNYVQTISIAYRAWELSEKNRNIAITGAKKFAKELNSGKVHKPSIKSVVMYNLWQGMSISGEDKECADYKFWSKDELKNTVYHPQISICLPKRVIGNVVKKMF